MLLYFKIKSHFFCVISRASHVGVHENYSSPPLSRFASSFRSFAKPISSSLALKSAYVTLFTSFKHLTLTSGVLHFEETFFALISLMFTVVTAVVMAKVLHLSYRHAFLTKTCLTLLCQSESNQSKEGFRQYSPEGIASQSASDRGGAGDL